MQRHFYNKVILACIFSGFVFACAGIVPADDVIPAPVSSGDAESVLPDASQTSDISDLITPEMNTLHDENAGSMPDDEPDEDVPSEPDTLTSTNAPGEPDAQTDTDAPCEPNAQADTDAPGEPDALPSMNTPGYLDNQTDADMPSTKDTQADTEALGVSDSLSDTDVPGTPDVLADTDTLSGPDTQTDTETLRGQDALTDTETLRGQHALTDTEILRGQDALADAESESAVTLQALQAPVSGADAAVVQVCDANTRVDDDDTIEETVPAFQSAAVSDTKQSGTDPNSRQEESEESVNVTMILSKTAADAKTPPRTASLTKASSKTVPPIKASSKTASHTMASPKTAAAATNVSNAAAGKKNNQLIQNGVYSFLSALNPFKAVDISGAGKANRANAQLYDLNNSDAQHFYIMYHPEDGTYSIMNINSGKYLDAAGGRNANGTNIQQYSGNNTPAQRWRIEQASDGWYILVSALDGPKRVLDINGASTLNRSNVQLYISNGTKAQKFRLQPYIPSLKVNIREGSYMLSSALKNDGSAVLDITGASLENGANVQLYRNNGSVAQHFILTNVGGNQYQLMSAASGRVVSMQNGKKANGVNVCQEQAGNLSSQKWLVMDAGDGSVYLKASNAEKYLDIRSGRTTNGTNVQIYQGNGTAAQKFRLVRSDSKPVEDGIYHIVSAKNSSFAADVYNGSKKMEANLQLYTKNGSDAQKFLFTRGKDGFYTIVNVKSGHALDVYGGSVNDGANVQQYRVNNTLAQKWLPRMLPDGTLLLINAKSGMFLDIADGKLENKANLRQEPYNRSSSQRFRLEKTDGTVTKKIDYSVEEPPLSRQYPQAYSVLKQVGMSLRAAYDWSVSLRFVDSPIDFSKGIRPWANMGFTKKSGNCLAQSATLYEMAKVLGYDVHVVFGYVPEVSGKLDDHVWLELDQNGKTLVLDPTFENLSGKSGYMFPYKTPNTFIYVNYKRMN